MADPCSRTRHPLLRRQAVSRWVVGLGVLAAAVLGTAEPAAAHDQLIETSPAADSTVETAPTEITLLFNQDVLDISTEVVVHDAAGSVVLDTAGSTEGPKVTAPFTTVLAAGAYTVAWRVVSGDGHPIQGSFAFSVAVSSAPSPTSSVAASAPSPTAGTTSAAESEPAATASPAAGGSTPTRSSSTPVWVGLGGAALLSGIVIAGRRRNHPPAP